MDHRYSPIFNFRKGRCGIKAGVHNFALSALDAGSNRWILKCLLKGQKLEGQDHIYFIFSEPWLYTSILFFILDIFKECLLSCKDRVVLGIWSSLTETLAGFLTVLKGPCLILNKDDFLKAMSNKRVEK